MAPRKMTDNADGSDGEGGKGSRKRQPIPKNSDEYKVRRNRNNTAVKKSRSKSRQKAKETVAKVNRLRQENDVLEQKVQILTKELSILKELFLTHAGPISDGTCKQQPDNNIQNDHKYFKKE